LAQQITAPTPHLPGQNCIKYSLKLLNLAVLWSTGIAKTGSLTQNNGNISSIKQLNDKTSTFGTFTTSINL
jgi:hypothetical protein